ncbi:MAG: hypothetical protein ND807_02695 [Vicinamibacterales bacterium]|nr:hypothetical protein [Vicinamibacterales bacterium]
MCSVVLAVALVCSTAVASQAQTTTSSTESKAFEVIGVYGNQLVVRLPEGTRELTVPDDFRFTVNGQQLSVRELRAGMKGTAVITTRTTVTPVTVTEVKSGTVMQTTGSSIIVRTPEGVKAFTQGDVDKRGVKIMRNGAPATISDFRQGDQLSATIITSMPPRVLTEKEVQATLAATKAAGGGGGAAGGGASSSAAAAPARSAGGGSSAAAAPQAQSQTSGASSGPATLPKTASSWPLVGLLGVLSIATGLALTVRRRFAR